MPKPKFKTTPLPNKRWSLLLPVLTLVICWLVLAWPWLSGTYTIPWDAKAHFQPQLSFLARSLATGDLPFWNPYVFAGSPQIADPQSLIFSPPFLALAWFDPNPSLRSMDSAIYLMLLFGALALLFFCRDMGWHPAGAVVAALIFAFGSSAAWRVQHIGQILSLAWLPITLLFLERALQRHSYINAILAGVFAACLALGRDQVAYLAILLLVAYVLAYWLSPSTTEQTRWQRFLGSFGPLITGAISGALVIGVPLFMTILLAEDSNRAAISLLEAEKGSFHPASLVTAVFANIFGTIGPGLDHWGPPSYHWGPTELYLARNMSNIYMGSLMVLMLAIGLARGWFFASKIRLFALGLLMVTLYALGRYTPIFGLIYKFLPGVDLFRRPADATFLVGALSAVIAGYGVHRILQVETIIGKRDWLAFFLFMLGVTGLIIYLAWLKNRLSYLPPALTLGWALMLGAFLLLIFIKRKYSARPHRAMLLLAAFLTLDLSINNGPNESTALPPELYEVLEPDSKNETIAFLRQGLRDNAASDRLDRVELAAIGFHWPNASMTHRLYNTLGYNPLRNGDYVRATGAGDQIAVADQKNFTPLMPSYKSTLSDMLGLRYIVTGVPIEEMDKKFIAGSLPLIARTKDAYIYENRSAMPRVMMVPEARTADFNKLIENGNWPQVDYRRVVLLAGEDVDGDAGDVKGEPGRARILAYGNTDIIVEVDSAGGGFLVLNDVWHPWWRADVDGVEAEILRANVIFRAVRVDAGRHRVHFSFKPILGLRSQIIENIDASLGDSLDAAQRDIDIIREDIKDALPTLDGTSKPEDSPPQKPMLPDPNEYLAKPPEAIDLPYKPIPVEPPVSEPRKD